MEHFKLVLPEHINHYGHLFGGYLLNWIDEFAYITATVDHPDCRFVTVAMDDVEFRRGIEQGEILRFEVEPVSTGKTSVRYRVSVYGVIKDRSGAVLFATEIAFVNVDKAGNKEALPGVT